MKHPRLVPVTKTLASLGIVLGLAAGHTSSAMAQEPTSDSAQLRAIIEQYLRTARDKEDAKLIAQIEALAAGDTTRVEEALRDARPWSSEIPNEGKLTLPALDSWPADKQPVVRYLLPAGYDISRRHPVQWLLMDDVHGSVPPTGSPPLPAIRLLIEGSKGGSLADGQAWADFTRVLLAESSRKLAIDEQRIHLRADRRHAAAGWMMALSAADRFAGVMIEDGWPDLPLPVHSYPLFMSNLRHTPVLVKDSSPEEGGGSESAAPPNGDEDPAAPSPQGILFRALEVNARLSGAPLKVIRRAASGDGPDAWETQVLAMLERARPAVVSSVSHWLGNPAQGSAWWLACVELEGDPWDAEAVSVLTHPEADRDAFVQSFFTEHLAHISGRIDDNQLTIESSGCAKLEVRLTRETIDWAKPLTITINGTKRHDAVIPVNMDTMLRHAQQGYLSLPIRAVLSFDVQVRPPRPDRR